MTTLNGLPRSWDSFIQGICARRMLISFNKIWEECAQEESILVTREENMGETDDQALTVYTRKNFKKKENKEWFYHNKKKDKKSKKTKIDLLNVRCYTCDEKGHFERDCPMRKRRHHVDVAEDDKPTNKIFRWEEDDSNEEYVLISPLTRTISNISND